METLRGKAINVQRSTHTSGSGGNNGQINTAHVATFELNKRTVMLANNEPLILNEGDEVKVAGKLGRDGVLKASAYYNYTAHVHGGNSGKLAIFIGWFLLVAGAIGLFTYRGVLGVDSSLLICMLPILLPAIGGGLWALILGNMQRSRWKAVEA